MYLLARFGGIDSKFLAQIFLGFSESRGNYFSKKFQVGY